VSFRHRIAVLTPSLPSRDTFRGCAQRSVSTQRYKPYAHLVGIDYGGVGPAEMRNQLADAAPWADWYALLDDDDEMYPAHLSTLISYHTVGDVIYSWPDTSGEFDHVFHHSFDPDRLVEESCIGCAALVRATTWRSLGGFRPIENEDWDFWIRALATGARFVCAPVTTWHFRLHVGNRFSG
jgi:hypothetical protein